MPPLHITVRPEWIETAIRWTSRRVHWTVDRQNMPGRTIEEKVDNAVQGEIASLAVMQYLVEEGRVVKAYDDIRHEWQERDPWDLVVGELLAHWPSERDDPRTPPPGSMRMSVKSSRTPPFCRDSILRAAAGCDFKILQYHDNDIRRDLDFDVIAQVYYLRGELDGLERGQMKEEWFGSEDVDAIASRLRARDRYRNCYLMGFAMKDDIVQWHANAAATGVRLTWDSPVDGEERAMWRAPLADLARPRRFR